MRMSQTRAHVLTTHEPPGRQLPKAGGAGRLLHDSLEERWRKYRKALKRVRGRCSEGSVHELRIETRRMLALLNLIEPFCPPEPLAEANRRFKKAFKNSGSLRDTQVQGLHIKKELKRFPEVAPFRKWLRRREKRIARRFAKSVHPGIKPKLKACMTALCQCSRAWVKRPDTANRQTEMLLKQVRTSYLNVLRLRKAVRANRPSTIHRLRIAFKAYRYLIETLTPEILRADTLLSELHKYQSIMGDIQDVEVMLASLGKFEKSKRKASLALFRIELKRRHAGLIKRFWVKPLPSAHP